MQLQLPAAAYCLDFVLSDAAEVVWDNNNRADFHSRLGRLAPQQAEEAWTEAVAAEAHAMAAARAAAAAAAAEKARLLASGWLPARAQPGCVCVRALLRLCGYTCAACRRRGARRRRRRSGARRARCGRGSGGT